MKIDKNIPLPEDRRDRRSRHDWSKLSKVGYSAFFKFTPVKGDSVEKLKNRMDQQARNFKYREKEYENWRFISRVVKEGRTQGVRIWRCE